MATQTQATCGLITTYATAARAANSRAHSWRTTTASQAVLVSESESSTSCTKVRDIPFIVSTAGRWLPVLSVWVQPAPRACGPPVPWVRSRLQIRPPQASFPTRYYRRVAGGFTHGWEVIGCNSVSASVRCIEAQSVPYDICDRSSCTFNTTCFVRRCGML